MNVKSLTLSVAMFALAGCASAPKMEVGGTSLMAADKVYTQTNLHPDIVRGRLYSINYQQDGLIPRCSEVKLLDVSGKKLIFSHEGREYHYFYHKASGDFGANLTKYFGLSCDKSVLSKLNAVDQKGLKEGKVYPGMTKTGVTLAIGYPPQHVTPSLDSDVWKFWSNRFNTFNVIFKNGVVERIQD